MNIVTTIIEALTEMVAGSASAIAEGAGALILNAEGNGLSSLGVVIFSLVGISFGVGIMGVIFALVVRR